MGIFNNLTGDVLTPEYVWIPDWLTPGLTDLIVYPLGYRQLSLVLHSFVYAGGSIFLFYLPAPGLYYLERYRSILVGEVAILKPQAGSVDLSNQAHG